MISSLCKKSGSGRPALTAGGRLAVSCAVSWFGTSFAGGGAARLGSRICLYLRSRLVAIFGYGLFLRYVEFNTYL